MKCQREIPSIHSLLLLWLFAGQVVTTACSSFPSRIQEAEHTVAIADSMDAERHLYADTAALYAAIRTLNKPIIRYTHRNALAAAYYYLGRSLEDSCTRISEAADCYIACDRLCPRNPVLRGRVNACMAYLCTQQDKNDLALTFNRRSTEAFRRSGDSLYFAYGLLYLSENYSQLGQHHTADSLWHIARTFSLGPAYTARLIELRGAWFYRLQQYDSALTCFLQAADFPRDNESRCYNAMKIMQSYTYLGQETQAFPYAEFIIANSSNPYYTSNAYYTLINYAEATDNVALAATYAHAREDAGRARDQLSRQYSVAVGKCRDYLANPYPNRLRNILLAAAVFVCLALLVLLYVLWHCKRHALMSRDALLQEKDNLIRQQSQSLEDNRHTISHLNETLYADRTRDFLLQVKHLRTVFPEPRKEWNDYATFKHDMSPTFLVLCQTLEQQLPEKEIKFCIYTILYEDVPLAQIADYCYYSPNGIRTTKGRIAQKLGATAASLSSTLLTLAVQVSVSGECGLGSASINTQ